MTDSPLDRKEKALAKAIKTMLKPLVRLLISQGITYIGLLEMLKRTYVEVAEESFTLEGKRQTDSRISLLTGVHRKEVKRLRSEIAAPLSEKEIKASKSAQMMALWTGHQAFLNEQGRPKPLYRTEQEGSPSFETLVHSVSKDKHPRSIMDEWLHQGVIILNDDGLIQLNEAGYVPEEDFEEKLFFAGKNIGDHLEIVAHNLAGEKPPLFDRAVYYEGLTPNSVDEVEQLSKQRMMEVLTEVNQRASQLQQQDQDNPEAQSRLHVGAYFYKPTIQQEQDG
jgi:hypothetical protein